MLIVAAMIVTSALPITVVAPLDERAELLRFRSAICEAWQGKRAESLWGHRASVDAGMSWEVDLAPDASGRMTAKVTERSTAVPVGITDTPPPTPDPAQPSGPLEYDVLEFVTSDGKPVASGAADCKAVAAGRIVPQLRSAATGKTVRW